MEILSEILSFNKTFVENKEYEKYATSKYPNKKIAILTCMDTRLVELLPKAMNLKNGDIKLIKNAGAIVIQPFGNIMRSLLVAVYKLKAQEIFVIGHKGCGMTGLNADEMMDTMVKEGGIDPETLRSLENDGIDLYRWLRGFNSVEEGVTNSVKLIRNHPLKPKDVPVHGLIMDPETGALELLTEGYQYISQ